VLRKTAELTSQSGDKIETAMFEDTFQQELRKYSFFRDTLSGNERKQTDLLARITVGLVETRSSQVELMFTLF
jgi:hypothetical protein